MTVILILLLRQGIRSGRDDGLKLIPGEGPVGVFAGGQVMEERQDEGGLPVESVSALSRSF